MVISANFLTIPGRRGKVMLMEDALATMISQAMNGRSVHEIAVLCKIPDHKLRDVIYGHSKRPKPETLLGISQGLGIAYERLALAAYGIVEEPSDATRTPALAQ